MATTQEKLDEVERLIEGARRIGWINCSIPILAEIAKDLRARLDHAPNVALVEIERRVNAVINHPIGGRAVRAGALADEVLSRWPVVKQSLERFGAEIESKGEMR